MSSSSDATDPVAQVISLSMIHYYGLVMETLLFGVYLVLASITFWILNERRKEGNPVSKIIVVCCTNIFLCTVIHWAGTVYHVYTGLVTYAARPDIGLTILYGSTTPVAVMRLAVFGVAGLTLDTMLIYRLWVVWGRRLIVVFAPIVSTVLGLIGTIMAIIFCTITPAGAITTSLKISIATMFTLQAVTNIICSTLMVIKIVRNSGGLAASKGQMMSLVWLIVESAAIYTSFSLCLMGLLISANSVSFIFGDMQSSIIGITSSLLIVRVAANSATSSNHQRSNTRSRGNSLFPGARTAGNTSSRFEDLPMKVSITRHAHVTRDDDNDMEHKMDLSGFPETPGSGANTLVGNNVHGDV